MQSVKLKPAVQNSICSKVVNNKAENKMHIDTEYERENGSSLDTNFISSPSPVTTTGLAD